MSSVAPIRPVRLALIGAGIYARDAHLPALSRLHNRFELVAIYSRSQSSAERLAAHWRSLMGAGDAADLALPVPELTTDLPSLLARPDIEAADIVLPIPVQAEIVAQALRAGKHVISEKPIAPSRSEALALLDLHRRHPQSVWMVAENWRYEETFVQSADLIRAGVIGRPLLAHWAQYTPMREGNKYFDTEWRRAGSYAGGYLLDSGVHHMAILRMLLGEATAVTAHVRQLSPELAPADTLTASLSFAGGAQAAYLNTYALATPFGTPLVIVGESGSLRIERGRIELSDNQGEVQVINCARYNGVDNELFAFASAIREGCSHRNTPLEALADLAILEAMLASARDSRQYAPLI